MLSGLESPLHLVVLGVIALLVFGPKKLPELGGSLGKGIREFRETISGEQKDKPAKLVQSKALASEDPVEAESSVQTSAERAPP